MGMWGRWPLFLWGGVSRAPRRGGSGVTAVGGEVLCDAVAEQDIGEGGPRELADGGEMGIKYQPSQLAQFLANSLAGGALLAGPI